MGKLSDDELDELFRDKLLGLEKDTSKEAWSVLAKDLSKNSFLTFGWKHFNIYQLIIASLLIISCIVYFVQQKTSEPLSEKETPALPSHTLIITDSASEKKSAQTTIDKKAAEQKILKKEKKKNSQNTFERKNNPRKEKIISDSTTLVPGISNEILPKNLPEIKENKQEEKPKPKKIITIVKRDTLVVKDTVSIKKKRKSK